VKTRELDGEICLGKLATVAPKQRKRPITSPQHLPFLQPTPIPSAVLSRSSAKSFEDARYYLFEEALGTSKGRSVN
jgi:hypothetical protein